MAAGRLAPGDRLAPQREFARQHGIATSTAARVYQDLGRRGLAVGEVGRGTFIRAARRPADPALGDPTTARVDLEMNFSVLPEQPSILADSLAQLLRPGVLAGALQPVGVHADGAVRGAATTFLSRTGWAPDPERVLFTGNGRQAIAATIAALVPVGDRLGVEALTFPVVKGIADRLGVRLVPLAMDDDGLTPDALRSANRATPLRAVYLQPTLHNPLGVTMPERRRHQIADVLVELDVYAIEDAVCGFLRDDLPPLAALAPERTVLVDSLSKRLAPGLTLGFAIPPPALTEKVAAAIRSGVWTAQHFAVAAASEWMTGGTAAGIVSAKSRDAAARQVIAREQLAGFVLRADPRAYHCWWELPEPWRAETFVAAAARRGIAVTPAAAFAVVPGRAPNAVRLALGSPSIEVLSSALGVLATLARRTPEDTGVE